MAVSYVTLALFKTARSVTATDRDELMQLAIDTASERIDTWTGRRRGGFVLDTAASARTFDPTFAVDTSHYQGRYVDYAGGAAPGGYFAGPGALQVDDIGDLAGLVVEQGYGTSWTDVTALVEPLPLRSPGDGRPVTALNNASGWAVGPYSRVRVTARWGWPVIPAGIAQACLILANKLYSRRNSPEGVLGSADWGVVRVGRVDPDVADLLAPFTIHAFA